MGGSYIVEVNIMGAIEAGEPVAIVEFTNSGVVEVEAELFDRGALLVPEGVAVGGVVAGKLLVALETIRAENEGGLLRLSTRHRRLISSSNVIIVKVNVSFKICYLVRVVFPQYCQGSSADRPATV